MLLGSVSFQCDIVCKVFCNIVDQVLLTTARRQFCLLHLIKLTYIESCLDILFLIPQYNEYLKDAYNSSHHYALNVDPEDLATVPSVPEIVNTCRNCWQVDESYLEQCIAIYPLVVLHTVIETG